jgi:hypothetical protein
MSAVQRIIERLEEDLESKEKQKDAVLDQLILIDVQIDEVLDVIVNMDRDGAQNLERINDAVDNVKKSYDDRFNAGCRTNLKWELVDDYTVNSYGQGGLQSSENYQVYEVVVDGGPGKCNSDSGVYGHTNYHGIKYWQRPMDRDYGAELISDFIGFINSGDLAVGMSKEQFGDENPKAPGEIKVGNVITDDLDIPQVFQPGNLPEIVSIGTTDVIGIHTSIIGGISTGSNTFYHFGGGNSDILTTGMILLEPIGSGATVGYGEYLSADGYSVITGFGTDDYELYYYNADGVLSVSTITVPTLTIDKPAIDAFPEGSFRVGFVTETVGFYLSTVSSGFATSERFYVIDVDDDDDRVGNFNPVSNPYSPEKISVITERGAGNLGAGHSVEYTSNGCPTSGTWNPYAASEEIRISRSGDDLIIPAVEEPEVGAGRADYWVGSEQWPTLTSNTYNQYSQVIPGLAQYATLGTKVTIGGTQQTSTYGYTSSPPSGVSGCSGYDNDINDALDDLSDAIAKYKPPTVVITNDSRPLKEEKDRLQLYAWSLLQAAASLRDDIKDIKERLSVLRNKNYSNYEN